MIKRATAQLLFQTIYCPLGPVGCIAALGIFDNINVIRSKKENVKQWEIPRENKRLPWGCCGKKNYLRGA